MNLHQLSIFRAIVETGSFSKAAAHLGLAQSAVSYHMKALEKELGGPLFSRANNKIQISEKGERLCRHTDKIFQAVADAEIDLYAQEPPSPQLHFGLAVSSLNHRLPAYVRSVQEACPGLHFRLLTGNTPHVLECLRSGAADLGIVSMPVHDPEIRVSPLFNEEEEMVVVTNRESPLASLREISPADLCRLPLILYNKTTATRASLDDFFATAGITPAIFMEVDREDTILTLVRSGLGATILPRCFLDTIRKDAFLHFLRLKNAYLRRQVGVAVKAGAKLPALVNTALHLCREHFHEAGSPPESRCAQAPAVTTKPTAGATETRRIRSASPPGVASKALDRH
ncbi:MAG TPA: LysR family transcriptional regulator [Bryobacteraceae bacterium]|nr:LysR family transcriptional regulator [Bryobacteraceae bacterium]